MEQPGSWQVVLADLSLILFAATALDAGEAPLDAAYRTSGHHHATAAFQGSADFARWLAQQGDDPRQRLTIVARHSAADREAAVADALRLADEARTAGFVPRIILEPDTVRHLSASLAFDQPTGEP